MANLRIPHSGFFNKTRRTGKGCSTGSKKFFFDTTATWNDLICLFKQTEDD